MDTQNRRLSLIALIDPLLNRQWIVGERVSKSIINITISFFSLAIIALILKLLNYIFIHIFDYTIWTKKRIINFFILLIFIIYIYYHNINDEKKYIVFNIIIIYIYNYTHKMLHSISHHNFLSFLFPRRNISTFDLKILEYLLITFKNIFLNLTYSKQ